MKYIVLVFVVFLFIAAWLGIGLLTQRDKFSLVPSLLMPSETNQVEMLSSVPIYTQGINAALDCFLLLNLEQQLGGTNRTMDEMSEIVCERLGVKRKK